MKKILTLILATMLVFSLIGCQADESSKEPMGQGEPQVQENDGNTGGVPQGITVNRISFERIALEDLDEGLQDRINEVKTEKGYELMQADESGYYYLAVFAGQKPSAGYSVKITSVMDNEGNTNVTVQETVPADDAMVSEVLTYPMDIVKLTGITDNVNLEFTTSKNEGDSDTLPVEDPETPVSSEGSSTLLDTQTVMVEYVGQVDSNSIEVKIEDGSRVLRLTGMSKEQLSELKPNKGDIIKVEVFEDENEQETVYKLSK